MYLSTKTAINQPSISTKGCRFHLGQSWWRQIQKLASTHQYRNLRSKVGQFLKLFFGLPFLDATEVEDCFVEDMMPLLLHHENVQKFAAFILENYIMLESQFPPDIKAEY